MKKQFTYGGMTFTAERIKELTMNKVHKNTNSSGEHRYSAPRRVLPRFAVIAASLIVILAFATVAFAANLFGLFGLRDIALPAGVTGFTPHGAGSQPSENPFANIQLISLQGYADSNEYKALAEWLAFKESYDEDGSILAELGNRDPGLDGSYQTYGAYTREMADKIDEIAERYGLRTLGNMSTVFSTFEELVGAAGHGDFIGEGITVYGGYLYETGTFQFEGEIGESKQLYILEYPDCLDDVYHLLDMGYFDRGDAALISFASGGERPDVFLADFSSGELVLIPCEEDSEVAKAVRGEYSPVYSSTGFQFRYCVKGVFDYVVLNIGNIDDYTQWQYETDCGITVTLAQSAYKSLLIVDMENAFVTVNVLAGSDILSVSDFEAFADSIDFAALN